MYGCRPTNSLHRTPPRAIGAPSRFETGSAAERSATTGGGGAGEFEQRWAPRTSHESSRSETYS
jgi:hypothetical protein